MHPALDKVDIVFEILSYLSDAELVAVAQTSRANFQAWIPFGWRIADEQHLVRLSNMVEDIEDVNCPCATPEISRRFKRYSASVRTLAVGYSAGGYRIRGFGGIVETTRCGGLAQDEALQNLQNYQPARLKQFLINIETLFIAELPGILPPAYESLVSQLRSLQNFGARVRHIISMLPSLEMVELDGGYQGSDKVAQSLVELAEASHNLKHVSVFHAQTGIDIMCQCRDRLTGLQVQYHEYDEQPTSLTLPEHLDMPKLEELDLSIPISEWIVLLSRMSAPQLSSVTMSRLVVEDDTSTWRRAFQLLPSDTLHQVTLICYDDWDHWIDGSRRPRIWNFRILAPLLQCRRLTHFKMNRHWPKALDIEDMDVGAMAAAWPELQVLTLYGLPYEPKLTLRCLEPLRDHCPNLRYVTLNRLSRTPTSSTYTPRHPSSASTNPLTLVVDVFELNKREYLQSLWRDITLIGI